MVRELNGSGMKIFLLTSLAAFVALSAASPTGLPVNPEEKISAELSKLGQIAEERSHLLREFLSVSEGAMGDAVHGLAQGSAPAPRPGKGLHTGRLQTGSLQPAYGVESGARGLTPEDEWRRMFPKKPNGQPRD